MLAAGARVIHVDVMDGHFVPPITFGALIVDAIAERVHAAGGILDVHLMIERPERYVADIARAGADSITIHVEATPHLHYTLSAIREAGCAAGAAINPGTPAGSLDEIAHELLDMALCMSVNPGWGDQQFIPWSLDKLARMRARAPRSRGARGRRRRPRGHRRAVRRGRREPARDRLGGVRLGRSGRRLRRDRRRRRRRLTRSGPAYASNSGPPLA